MSRPVYQALLISRQSHLRNHSTRPAPNVGLTVSQEDIEKAATKRLEDAIHRFIVSKSQPDWIPLVPGGSYWVPPKSSSSRRFAKLVSDFAKDATCVTHFVHSDHFSLLPHRAWPTCSTFFIGESHSSLEGEMNSKHPDQSEGEEEG